MVAAPAPSRKSITIYIGDLSFIRQVDGEIVEQGQIKHPRVLDTLCGYFTHIGYSVTRKKGLPVKTMFSAQQQKTDTYQRDVLQQLQAGTLEPKALHNKTRTSMIKRGFLDLDLPAPHITEAGQTFMSESPASSKPISSALTVLTAPAEVRKTDIRIEHEIDRESEAAHRDDVVQALRDLRDTSLGLVENILSEKAPEALPVMASIRQANRILDK
jgi:hypothetical protein